MGWCTAQWTQWKMLQFCVIMSHKFELAHLQKKKNILAVWKLSGWVLSRCFLAPLGVFFVMKNSQNQKQLTYRPS